MTKKHTQTQTKGPSQRQLRVGEVMRHALAELLSRIEVDDPDLAGVTVTVTEIRPSPDLRNAAVFVMPLGGLREKEVVAALNRHARFLRGEAARRVSLRHMPELKFMLDASFAEAGKIDAILRSPPVARDLDADED
jgi:ribosome-binding factor A